MWRLQLRICLLALAVWPSGGQWSPRHDGLQARNGQPVSHPLAREIGPGDSGHMQLSGALLATQTPGTAAGVTFRRSAFSGCAAAYTGEGCDTPRSLPCWGRAFPDRNSLTLNQAAAQAASQRSGRHSPHPLIPQQLLAHLPPLPFLGQRRGAFEKCALVGNSPSLMEASWGEEIDEHDLVVRCNNAPTQGFVRRVGRWTSFRYQNERYSGFQEGDEPTIGRYCSTFYVKGMVECEPGSSFLQSLSSDELKFMLVKKMHPLNPVFDHWIEEPFRRNGTMPSTGFRALAVLLHLCSHIDMYGFGGTGSFRVWYWNKYKGYTGKPPPIILRDKFPKMIKQVWKRETWEYAGEKQHSLKGGRLSPGNSQAALAHTKALSHHGLKPRHGRGLLKSKKSSKPSPSKKPQAKQPSEHDRGLIGGDCLAPDIRGGPCRSGGAMPR